MASERFSLLLPVYSGDKPAYLERAFRSSVPEQTHRPDDVVIVQDGPIPYDLTGCIAALVESSPVPVRLVTLTENETLVRRPLCSMS